MAKAKAKAKALLRAEIKHALGRMSDQNRMLQSALICDALKAFCETSEVLLYSALATEVELTELRDWCIETFGYCLLPRVNGEAIDVCQVTEPETQLFAGAYGIWEPMSDVPLYNPKHLQAVIVPGLAFDPSGYRLGRGKGFYDRFLERYGQCKTIGVGFMCQLVEQVPTEEHDQVLDHIVSPSGVVK